MFWACFSKVLIFISMPLIFVCIDFATTSTEECFSAIKLGVYYSRKASNSYGELLKTFENNSAIECQRKCCNFEQCNLMMYSTVLRDHERTSNITCFLFNCSNISRCITKPLPENITGVISLIGIRRENITNLGNNLNYNNSNVEQHQIGKLPLNSTVHTSGIQPSVTTLNTGKPNTNILDSNQTSFNNSDAFGLLKTTNLPPKVMHSPFNSTSIPMKSLGNVSHSTLSMVTPPISSLMHTPGILRTSNHSPSLLSYSANSLHNTNHSTLSTVLHSTPTLHMHTPVIQPESNHSSHHVGFLSGTYSTANSGLKPIRNVSHTVDKISHVLSHSMFVSVVVDSLKSNEESHVATSSPFVHASQVQITEAALSTMSSLGALHENPNISSSFFGNSQVSKSSHSPTTSHTSKGDQNTRRKFSERESHTTPVSLVISLIFGILFFSTVVFLIGRRWSEQCFRRGYSRVDYLLNDYD